MNKEKTTMGLLFLDLGIFPFWEIFDRFVFYDLVL